MKYHLKEREWEQILAELRMMKRIHTKQEAPLRRFMEAIWYMNRSGCQWRLLPEEYGNWRSVHLRFKSWGDTGIWARLFEKFQIDPDTEVMMVDATVVRAHPCAAGYGKDSQTQESLGRSKGGFTTKIHALVDGLGNPLKFILTPGQRHDITQAENLTADIADATLLADKGYDSNAFVDKLKSQGCTPVIPTRSSRKIPRDYDKHLYKERHLIECFFNKIKHFRRIFSRFDKSAVAYMAFLNFTGIFIWLR
jgi:transposase